MHSIFPNRNPLNLDEPVPAVLRTKLPPNLEKIKNGHYTKDDADYAIHLYLKENDIQIKEDGSEIVEFLKGKNVLITGATGFLGKALLEKLLRSCKDIGNVYIIIRPKRGKDLQSRVSELLDNWVFYKLSKINPNYHDKVIGIGGDLEIAGLGLSADAKEVLKEVNIIYHVAASIRFNDPLKKATNINLRGTKDVLEIAKQCNQLDAFVHVSTAYSNCHEKTIKEKFYLAHFDPYKLLMLCNELPDDIIEQITPGLLREVPNTYVFSKQLTEELVKKETVGMPACIIRPSVVLPTVKEPVRNWMDNIFGPIGIIKGAGIGLLRIMYANPEGECNMIPADYVINNCIAASYKTAKDGKLSETSIYNCTSVHENPIYWKHLTLPAIQGVKVGSTQLIWKFLIRFTTNYYWYLFLNLFLHTIPAYIVDSILLILGKKPLLIKGYGKIHKHLKVLQYFTSNEWNFVSDNTRKLWRSLNDIDKANFMFDMKSLDWHDTFDTYVVSGREFLLKDFLDTLNEGRRHQRTLSIIHYILLSLLLLTTTYFLANTLLFFIPLSLGIITLYYYFTDYVQKF